jgi:hypothetical protein
MVRWSTIFIDYFFVLVPVSDSLQVLVAFLAGSWKLPGTFSLSVQPLAGLGAAAGVAISPLPLGEGPGVGFKTAPPP